MSDLRLTEANGMAERDAALDMLMRIPGSRPLSVGGDRGYDTRDFVAECRELNITPHIARKKCRSAIAGRTTRHAPYRSSQKARERVESISGWMKTVGGFRRSGYVGLERTRLCGELVATVYDLVRMSRLIAGPEAEVEVRLSGPGGALEAGSEAAGSRDIVGNGALPTRPLYRSENRSSAA